jgi:hypothetical protein
MMINSAWRCELPLWKAFWLLHLLGTLVLGILGIAAAMLAAILVVPSGSELGALMILTTVVAVAVTYIWSLFTLFLVWGNAGNTLYAPWRVLAQAYVIFNLLYLLLTLIF